MKMFFGNNHTVLNYIVLIFSSWSFYQMYFRVLGMANILFKKQLSGRSVFDQFLPSISVISHITVLRSRVF